MNNLSIKLARAWDRNYNLRAQQFVNWHNGFTIPATTQMAVELWDNRELQHQITVEATDELSWWIDRLDRTSDGQLAVTCRPHIQVLKNCLYPDAYLVDLWLAAEKQWQATQTDSANPVAQLSEQSDSPRDRIAAIIHDKDTLKCCDECTISSPGPWDYEVADAIMAELKLAVEHKPTVRGWWQRRYTTPWITYRRD